MKAPKIMNVKGKVLGFSLTVLLAGCGGGVESETSLNDIRDALDDFIITSSGGVDSIPLNTDNSPETVDEITEVVEEVIQEVVEETNDPEVLEDVVEGLVNVRVGWEATLLYEDNSPMEVSDIDYFEIAYGASADNMDQKIRVMDPFLSEYDVSLAKGSYFVAVRTISIYGGESDYSNVLELNID